MKLKSKLIATIVSICAAIAVMGVGVWAATSNFTVSVTNNVNVSFSNMTGTIGVVATAQKTEQADGEGLANIEGGSLTQELYNAATTTATSASIGANGSSADHKWAGADLFNNTNINNKTTKAVLTYTFTYTPAESTTSAGWTTIQITPTEPEAATKGASMTYEYKIGTTAGGNAAAVDGVTFYAADNVSIVVTITATYENLNLVAAQVGAEGQTWAFSVAFTNTLTEPSGGTKLTA